MHARIAAALPPRPGHVGLLGRQPAQSFWVALDRYPVERLAEHYPKSQGLTILLINSSGGAMQAAINDVGGPAIDDYVAEQTPLAPATPREWPSSAMT